MKFGKVFGDEMGMIKTAFAKMFRDGGEWNDNDRVLEGRNCGVENFGERASQGANGVVFEIVDKLAD